MSPLWRKDRMRSWKEAGNSLRIFTLRYRRVIMASLYDVLNVAPDASEDELKRAHRRKQRETHPDVAGGDAEAFRAVEEAWAILGDELKRTQYDRSRLQVSNPTVGPDWAENLFYPTGNGYVSTETLFRMAEEVRKMEEESTLRRMEYEMQREQVFDLMRPSFPFYGRLFSWGTGWYAGSYRSGVTYDRVRRWKRVDTMLGTLILAGLIGLFVPTLVNVFAKGDVATEFFGLFAWYLGLATIIIFGHLLMWGYRWYRWVLRPNLQRFSSHLQ